MESKELGLGNRKQGGGMLRTTLEEGELEPFLLIPEGTQFAVAGNAF